MIEETKRKIHFIPFKAEKGRKPDVSKPPVVSVSTKYNRLTFGKKTIKTLGMGGKFIKLYYEPTKKIIGWRITDKLEQAEMKSWKLCQPKESVGVWYMAISGILDEMRLKPDFTYSDLPIQKYREMENLDPNSGQIFYFVEVKEALPE